MARYPEKRRAALEATMHSEVYRVAAEILREDGLEALTMDRIAREIGVSRGTLYNYFADADAVLNFVEARSFDPVAERIRMIGEGAGSPRSKLDAIARAAFDCLYEDRALVMALFAKWELRGPRAEQKKIHREQFISATTKVIEDGIADGSIRKIQPPLAAELFLGAMGGMIDSMMYAGELKPAAELVPGLMDFVLRGLEPRETDPDEGPKHTSSRSQAS